MPAAFLVPPGYRPLPPTLKGWEITKWTQMMSMPAAGMSRLSYTASGWDGVFKKPLHASHNIARFSEGRGNPGEKFPWALGSICLPAVGDLTGDTPHPRLKLAFPDPASSRPAACSDPGESDGHRA